MKEKIRQAIQRVMVVSALTLVAASSARATDFQWFGTTDGNWTTPGNWNANGVGAFGGTYLTNRLNVNNAANNPLVYDASLGTTIYSNYASGGRGLVIGSGSSGSGTMRITGGTFSTAGSNAGDVIGNGSGNIGQLIIDGGAFVGNSAGLSLGIGGGPTSILTLTTNGGSATVATLTLNNTTGTVNLDGGVLTANKIQETAGNNTFNFNGGTLQAGADSTDFMAGGFNAVVVKSGGAHLDTNGKTITIGQSLADGGGGGGLVKTGGGTLTLTGANAYSGGTIVSNGQLALNRTGGPAILGNVALTSTSASRTYLRLLQSGQLESTAVVSMELKGTGNVYSEIALQGNAQTLAGITANWDAGVGGGSTVFIENRVFNDAGGGNGVLTIDGASDTTLGSRVLIRDGHSGTLSLVKLGAGTLSLDGAGTYSGDTLVSNGLLNVNGTYSGGGTFRIHGGTLGGTGSVGSVSLAAGGTLAPGNSAGLITVAGTLDAQAGSFLSFEVASTNLYDRVVGITDLTLNGTVQVSLLGGFSPQPGDSFDLVDFSGSLSGSYTLDLPALADGNSWNTANFAADGSLAVIPEPATLGLLLSAALVAGLVRRRWGT